MEWCNVNDVYPRGSRFELMYERFADLGSVSYLHLLVASSTYNVGVGRHALH